MTVRATKFTPEVLLSAPRRSSAAPDHAGKLALYTLSTYSFEAHSKRSEIRVIELKSGQSTLYTDDANATEPNWIGTGTEFMFLRSNGDGTTSVVIGDAGNLTQEYAPPFSLSLQDRAPPMSTIRQPFTAFIRFKLEERVSLSYVAGTIEGPVSNLKVKLFENGTIAFVVSGQATPDGDLFNPQKARKPYSSGKVYTSLFVRHWDSYLTPNRNSIWYATLQKGSSGDASKSAKYELAPPGPVNALRNTGLESPISPFGGTDNFDVSCNGILFVAKDPKLNQATTMKADPYFIPLSSLNERSPPEPQIINVEGLQGGSTCPTFSPDGRSAAFLRMKEISYESDKNRVIMVPDVHDLSTATEVMASSDGRGAWSLSPGGLWWSMDGKTLLLTADRKGRGVLFSMPASPAEVKGLPRPVWEKGCISDVRAFPSDNNNFLISSASLVDNSYWFVLNPSYPDIIFNISSNSNFGKTFGLSPEQMSEIWFPGAEGHQVHALVMKPTDFDERNKYPLAYLIHGGPQGSWQDNWSTRWSPAVFAEQGYIVVAPNITGSTGYGQDFVDRIQGQWGGYPYEDLVKGFEYIEANLPYVDTDRAVCLGASYGGYATLWIQGQPLGRKFKALVTHDGVFSTINQYSSEELWFPNHDFCGTLWDQRAVYERWDPSRFTGNWATPHLIIHNELDYRLPISEGLAAFNVLQQRGVESKFLTFPDENHWVLKPENSLHWHVEVLNWINHYVGLPPYVKAGESETQNGPPPEEEMKQLKVES
ncbi:MAG: hypothetical protein M1837_004523 [Sclerophora amabilis]|nr:MAG: hypothetical protein M1837_004523 [Sclerophora amabilis]